MKNKDRAIRTPLKTGCELGCSGRASSSCSTCTITRVTPNVPISRGKFVGPVDFDTIQIVLIDFNIILDYLVLSQISLSQEPVPNATNVVSSNSVHGEVYSIQHYVIKFVSDLRQVGGFLPVYSGFLHQ